MKNKTKDIILRIWPLLTILGIVLVLALRNYTPGTWLIGWDNLIPEFDLSTNIQRSLFAVWQEYQGLGLLGGMAHAADLVHQFFLAIISLFAPDNTQRYIWTFLMMLTGSTGAYFLVKKLILKESTISEFKLQTVALTASIFYLLNLSTIQTFYAPFEAFIGHFAALPWLLLASTLFFLKNSFKNAVFLVIVLILATPQAYIPTLFLVYILSLLILTISLSLLKPGIHVVKSFIKMFALIIIVNSFWLLPFFNFTLNNSQVALNAKINQMSTETIFLQNKEFGDVFDVMLLKGFWFNNIDPDKTGTFTYMLTPWKDYLSNNAMTALGIILFGVIIAGIIASIKKRKPIFIAFALLFLFSFTMLSVNTFPFSWFDILFRKIPLFNEAFRFPFTKFSVLTSLTYAIFFALGILWISSIRFVKKVNFYLLVIVFCSLIGVSALPVFQGHLFYDKERIEIPNEYFQTFDFFAKQDPNTRIANLPQPTHWGWEFYNWGFGGSGFPWYGIKQPILDRAFDVWSRNNENYYWELSQAIYSKNPALFENVMNKYQITWILVDNNIIYPSSPRSLFKIETETLIAGIPSITKAASFGNLSIYKVSLKDNPNNFVLSSENPGLANSYLWGNEDKAYSDFGNYVSKEGNKGSFYPFRSLFSNKNQKNLQFKIVDEKENLILENSLPEYDSPISLEIPSFASNEKIVAATFLRSKNPNGSSTINISIRTPEIAILDSQRKQKKVIYSKSLNAPLVEIPASYADTLNISVNGVKNYEVKPSSADNLGTTFLIVNQDNTIVVNGNLFSAQVATIKADLLFTLLNEEPDVSFENIPEGSIIQITIPKINDEYQSYEKPASEDDLKRISNCDNFSKESVLKSSMSKLNGKQMLKFESRKGTSCIYSYIPNLMHEIGYAIFVESAHGKGLPLHFWVLNEDEKFSPIDTYLAKNKEPMPMSFVLPPQEKFGRAYSLHFDNISVLNDDTVNYLGNIALYPFPYNFVQSINLVSESNRLALKKLQFESVTHPNESLYVIEGIKADSASSVILSQSFDPGWKLYKIESLNPIKLALPFVFGSEVKDHYLVNNWENGWTIERINAANNISLVILYVPQYLEFAGFILLFILLVALSVHFLIRKNQSTIT